MEFKDQNNQIIRKGDIVLYTDPNTSETDKGVVTSISPRGAFVRFSGETSQLCPASYLRIIGTITDKF